MTDEQRYWGSLEEYYNTPEYTDLAGKEFVSPPAEETITEMQRRDFLKIMGAGMLLAGAACSRRPVEKIIPYVNAPLEIVPGIANWYTSTCQGCAAGCGVLVKTREGRPVKLEGNPNHPVNQGALCARGQASLLSLYDPDRTKGPVMVNRGQNSFQNASWEEVDRDIMARLNQLKEGDSGVYLFTGAVNSPSTQKLIQEFLAAYPGGKHVAFDALVPEDVAQAQALSYGEALIPRYRFDKAQTIVTFGADFLGTWLSPVEFSKRYSKSRRVDAKRCSRLIAFEGALTLTGMNADEHHPIKSGDEVLLALALAGEVAAILSRSGLNLDSATVSALSAYPAEVVAQQTGVDVAVIKATAQELARSRTKGLVLGGGFNSKNGLALQVAVNLLNSMLENDGMTVDYSVAPSRTASSYAELIQLVADMNQGKVKALLIYEANPLYSLPASLGFKGALEKVPLVVSFADRMDETAVYANYLCPTPHSLESWGDANPWEGLYSIVQPTIAPLYDTRPFQENLLKWSGSNSSWHDYLKDSWENGVFKEAGGSWEATLENGYLAAKAVPFMEAGRSSPSRNFNGAGLAQALSQLENLDPASYRLALYPSIAMADGRSSNNGWLQELPDPISKITWDNYVSIAPEMADALGIRQGAILRFKGPKVDFEAPVCVQPGMHPKSLMMAVGYGRTHAGRVGNQVGIGTQALQMQRGKNLEWSGLVINTIDRTGKNYRLAATVMAGTTDSRPIVKDASFKEFLQNPAAGKFDGEKTEAPAAAHALPTLWTKHEYKGYRWGMAIDTNACTGCSACMIGCQSENNVPTVGRDRVLRGREMHWLRIDRYYKGGTANPKVAFQPMLCQHCENAPCETVCPVLATVHDDEGLNTMIYNRCVGTRYCSNNCPYKVRRFNYFEYTKNLPDPVNLVLNPDLTVREKGVMEKCTFCMQRIRSAKDTAKDEGRKVHDGDIKTACQQSCPTDAIIFGDTNDPNSQVSKLRHSPRGYRVLEDLNTEPQVTYLTKIRNI